MLMESVKQHLIKLKTSLYVNNIHHYLFLSLLILLLIKSYIFLIFIIPYIIWFKKEINFKLFISILFLILSSISINYFLINRTSKYVVGRAKVVEVLDNKAIVRHKLRKYIIYGNFNYGEIIYIKGNVEEIENERTPYGF